MILKDLMEEKQLNFNQPILSVRRFSSTLAAKTDHKRKTQNSLAKLPHPPAYKSELKSGPVRNPGTIPFVWEKIPGKPKDQSKPQTQTFDQPPITPNLPPGRVSKLKQQDSDIKGASVTEMRTASTVSNSHSLASIQGISNEEVQQKPSSDSDDGSETYLDALDTLSRAESFIMSCSGLSGWDDQEVQPCRSFSYDQQARDFIIDRFLPAAKAMTSETPQYPSRKLLVEREQQKQVKKVVIAEKSGPLNQHRPETLPHYIQHICREGSEDESDHSNDSENHTTAACGLLPRLCLLNPIPGSRMEDNVQSSAVHGMQARSTASGSKTIKEHGRTPHYGKKSVDSQCGFAKEKDMLCVHEKCKHGTDPHPGGCSKLSDRENTQHESSYESPVVEKTLYVDSVHKVKSRSSSCSSEMKGQNGTNQKGDGFETLRTDRSIYKNLPIDSSLENSKHLDVVGVKATSQPKISGSLVCSENSSNGMQMELRNHSKKIDSKKLKLTKPGNQESDTDKALVVISPKVVECNKIDLKSQVYISKKSSYSQIQNSEVDVKSQAPTKWVDKKCSHGSTQYPSTSASSKGASNGKIDLERQCLKKLGHEGASEASYLQLPLVLPSLKAPSDSWLKRTLPIISSRNICSRSNILVTKIYARSQTAKTASLYPKWETVVKSSNVHHGQLKLREELLTPILEA